ncbi:hypothetical protein IAT38_007138 [Cryptococcus sp. DSM 104549]
MTDLAANIEPFLLLARSTRGAAAAKIVMDATAAPGVYVFSELLEIPNIQQLASDPTFGSHYQLLRLFAYGTLAQYQENTALFPDLWPSHLVKLKHLTLVSLAHEHRSLPYDRLLSTLQLDSTRQLEDLIIDTIYAGLLAGKIHHQEAVLHVDWVAGRDLRAEDLVEVQKGLANWCQTAQTLLQALDTQIAETRELATTESRRSTQYAAHRNNTFETALIDVRRDKRGQIPSGASTLGGAGGYTGPGGIGSGGLGSAGSQGLGVPGHGGAAAGPTGGRAASPSGGGGRDIFSALSAVGASFGGRINLTRNISGSDDLEAGRATKRPKD